MNGTALSSTDPQDDPQGQNLGGYGYGLGLSVGVLLFIIIMTYCSYVCTRSRSRITSTHRSYSITTTTTENDLVSPRGRGIDEITLSQYPKLLYSDTRVHHNGPTASGCSICLADYKCNDMIRLLPECGHFFHLSCIDPWLRKHVTCPICRTPPGPTPLTTPLAEVVPLADLHA